MDRVFIFLACLAAFLVLCQWFVFAWTRKYLFQRYQPISRKLAYSVLGLIAVLNFVAIQLSFETTADVGLSLGRKIASVVFFSYLGIVLMLSLFFLALGAVWSGLRGKDAVAEWLRTMVRKPTPFSSDQRGFLNRAARTAPEACALEPQAMMPEDRRTVPGGVQQSTEAAVPMGCRQGDHRIEGPTRRTFLKWGTAAAVAVAFGEAGRGLVEAYQRPVIEEFDLLLPGLDGLTKPLTLIQVTDFHFGQFLGNSDLQGLVDLLNTLDGDMVIITGDIFHSPVTPIGDAPDILRTLRPRSFGNLAVMGNHDFYAGEARSVDAMQAGGLKLLRNQWMTLEEKGTRIYLGGIDDPMANWIWGAKFPGFMSFMEKAPGGRGARILLSHRPSVLPVAADAGIDFVMAGHIHGGQIVVPWPGVKGGLSLAGIASEYTRGWYQAGKCRMYLNRGVGLTFVPWRINCPPEIAVMNLKPSPAHDSSVLKTRTVTTGSDREKT